MKLFTKIALNFIGIIVFLILSIYISNMLYLKYFLEDMIIDDLKKLSQDALEDNLEGDLFYKEMRLSLKKVDWISPIT